MGIYLVHISDIHLSEDESAWIDKSVEKLKSTLSIHCNQNSNIIFTFTGDLANRGKKSEYESALKWINKIRSELEKLSFSVDFVIVPGNHDCDFSKSDEIRNIVLERIKTDEEIKITEALISTCTQPQKNFFEFLFEVSGETPNNKLMWKKIIQVGNYELSFNCLNTAWTSTINESEEGYGKQVFPSEGEFRTNGDFVITIFHHPPNWQNQSSMHSFILEIEKSSDLALSGHEHFQKAFQSKGLDEIIINKAPIGKEGDCTNFNLIEIRLEEDQAVNKTFINNDPSKEIIFDSIRKKSNKFKYPIKTSYYTELNSVKVDLGHSKKEKINLSEIFVWPTLKLNPIGSDTATYFEPEDYCKHLTDHKEAFIACSQHGGRTSFAKSFFIEVNKNGKFPLLVSFEDIHLKKKNKLVELFDSYSKDNYEGIIFEHSNLEDRILIVDNFNIDSLAPEKLNKLRETLSLIFNHVFYLTDDSLLMNSVFNQELSIENIYQIIEFNGAKKIDLIKKWLRIGNEGMDLGDEQIQLRYYARRVDETLNANLIPKSPFYMLLILNNIMSMDGSSEGFSSTSLALIERMIKISLSTVSVKGLGPDGVESFLAYLSFQLSQNENKISHEKFVEICEYHSDQKLIEFSPDVALKILVQKKILKSPKNKCYSFHDDFVYYYFIGQYIGSNYSKDESVRENFKSIIKKCYMDDASNIIVFTAYFSNNDEIFQLISDEAREFLNQQEEVDLIPEINDISGDNQPIESNLGDREEHHETALAKRLDENESISQQIRSTTKKDNAKSINVISRAYKYLNILGQTLQNRAGGLDGDLKESLANEVFSLSRRLISLIYQAIKTHRPSLEEHFKKMVKESEKDKQSKTPDKVLEKRVREYIFRIFLQTNFNLIDKISITAGCSTLKPLFKKLAANNDSTFINLCFKQVHLEYSTFEEIDFNVLEKTKKLGEQNFLVKELNRLIVYDFIATNDLPYKLRQQLCEDYNIKNSPKLLANKPSFQY